MARSMMRGVLAVVTLVGVALSAGCTRSGQFAPVDMWNRSRLRTLGENTQFADDQSAQPLVHGTVARGELDVEDALYSGRANGKLVTKFPFKIDETVIHRGQERFGIYCSPCHGRIGDGNGMIVQRGFPHPPDYAIPRLRKAPVGHFYDVITNGYGVMYSYASRVPPSDRWAIAAYIRALQSVRPVVPAPVGERVATLVEKSRS